MTRFLLLSLLMPCALLSQEPSANQRPRVIDPASQPTAGTGTIGATTTLPKELQVQIEIFFNGVRERKVEEAWNTFLGKSVIGKNPPVMSEFISKTKEILRVHGAVTDYELLRVRATGKHLREIVYQLSCENHPTRWRIYAYQSKNQWQILDVDVSSDLTRMFE
jgi:hypothetical protein